MSDLDAIVNQKLTNYINGECSRGTLAVFNKTKFTNWLEEIDQESMAPYWPQICDAIMAEKQEYEQLQWYINVTEHNNGRAIRPKEKESGDDNDISMENASESNHNGSNHEQCIDDEDSSSDDNSTENEDEPIADLLNGLNQAPGPSQMSV